MAAKRLTESWNAAMAAKPSDWRMMGLRCGSTGLGHEQRSDDWIAEACGPAGACIEVRAGSPEAALHSLAVQLRGLSR